MIGSINKLFGKQLVTLVALTGVVLVVLHPLQHAAEISINTHDFGHVENPFSSDESETNELDCINCVLSVFLIIDFDLNKSCYNPSADLLNSTQIMGPIKAQFEVDFSLRAPPIIFG